MLASGIAATLQLFALSRNGERSAKQVNPVISVIQIPQLLLLVEWDRIALSWLVFPTLELQVDCRIIHGGCQSHCLWVPALSGVSLCRG
eukprot:3498335-Amphidinium_carterae.2